MSTPGCERVSVRVCVCVCARGRRLSGEGVEESVPGSGSEDVLAGGMARSEASGSLLRYP